MALVRIPLKDIKQLDIMSFKNGKTGSEIRNTYKPDSLINLALYDMTSKENIVFMFDNKTPSGYLFSKHGIGITKEGLPVWTNFDDAKNSDNVIDFIGGAPVLVIDAKVNIDWGNKVSTQIQGRHIRTAFGFNSTELILYVSEDEITLDTLAKRMLGYGCKYAINCDGGGSSYLYESSKTYKSSIRANPTWLLVYKKKKEEIPMNKKYKICLDAGHGGSDPGATYNTFYEKDVTLKVVNLMKAKLEPYVDVVLTRTKDNTVSLEERVIISNKANVNYFVSIHCNSSVNTAAKGWECYIIAKGGNAEKLANKIRNITILNNSDILKDRGIKTANFYVLKNTVAPAVLIENAFISNYDDRNNVLKSDTALDKLATAYSKAILEMLDIKTVEPVKDTKDFDWALTVLEANKVINSKDYWVQNKTKLEYLDQLIINMAKYIEDNK
jgi:N-acetylmuramoyl-L-alanine amidase